MKKNILFIIPSLGAGGGEKSLINLLTQMDFTKYNVDLFLLNNSGLFMDFIPKEVNILEISDNVEIFNKGLKSSVLEYLAKGNLKLAFNRIIFCLKNRLNKNIGKAEQYSWKNLRTAIGVIDNKYDIAIGYLEKTSNYICVDCVQADKKIGWIHTDYNKLDIDENFDKIYFNKLDEIITVSDECKNTLISNFKSECRKVKVIKNIVSPTTIKKMAEENVDITRKRDEVIIISVGRLSSEKGFDIAVEACKRLIDKKINIKWYLIGEGSERSYLEELILKNNLEEVFILLGAQCNPYKYIKQADIYVQPSRFEGKSIAMDEAKILCKPMVATNFSTVNDQIVNKVDGIITEMNEVELANGIEELINNKELYFSIMSNLKKLSLGTENEINRLYKIIE